MDFPTRTVQQFVADRSRNVLKMAQMLARWGNDHGKVDMGHIRTILALSVVRRRGPKVVAGHYFSPPCTVDTLLRNDHGLTHLRAFLAR